MSKEVFDKIMDGLMEAHKIAISVDGNAAEDMQPRYTTSRLRREQRMARNNALEQAADYIDRIAHEGLHASMWRNKFKQVSDAIRAMKDKP